jgi:hypothetical protein
MRNTRTYILFVLSLVVLFAALGGAGWVFSSLTANRGEVAARKVERSSAVLRASYALTLRSLARDTNAERNELRQLTLKEDALAIIEVIEDAGKDAGVSVSIGSVTQGIFPTGRGGGTLPAVSLSIHAEGSFAGVYYFLSLLETLPALSFIDFTDFELTGNGDWRALIRMRVASETVYE